MKNQEYWDWVLVILFLLITVDMLLSIYAAHLVGLEYEANEIMKYVLSQSIITIIIVHIIMAVIVVVLFYGLRKIYNSTEKYQKQVSILIQVFLGLLLFLGFFVFTNNLTLIILEEDLITKLSQLNTYNVVWFSLIEEKGCSFSSREC